MRNRNRKVGRYRIFFLRFFVIFTLASVVGILAIGVIIQTHFAFHFPSELLHLTKKGESPRFYAYHFQNRFDREGEIYEITADTFAQKQSLYLSYPDIPRDMINAVVAIEDKRFFEHSGVDWFRTVAAGINYALGYTDHFGASTITQQLVKNLTGNDEVTLSRKLQEILYALDLERTLDKSEIMELYLNVIHFSDNCDGIAQAAEHYFSKNVSELTLTECASIVAITNSPSYYNPIRNPENNRMRRNLILSEMYAQEFLSQDEYQAAISEDLTLNVTRESCSEGINSWYVDMVIEDVLSDLQEKYSIGRAAASKMLYSGGLRIETAMDEDMQSLIEEYYRTAVQLPKNQDGVSAQSALIAIDSRTGDILGVAGAAGTKKGNRLQNFATQTLRPPGSALKPISVYAPALERGLINWASVYDDVPVDFGKTGKAAWPRNATGVYRGLTNVAYAVAHSTNTVPVRILQELGLENSFSFAKEKFHLTSMVSNEKANDCDLAALALGQLNYGVTLRELTAAYTVFADGGVYHPYRSYYRVLDSDGRILLSAADSGELVMSVENAAIMTKLLQGVVERGTSSAVTLRSTVECAGKTGTTNRDGDRWFIGYTPDIICGVWCGYEYPEPLEGKNLCTSIWNNVMRSIVEKKGGRASFDIPPSVVRASYCKDSGALLTEVCQKDPRGSREEIGWFVHGSEPSSPCTCHVGCQYDTVHGGVSHGSCAKEDLGTVGLIRVKRDFPMQIYVSDAQYVYDGDPLAIPPNEDDTRAYFEGEKKRYRGISAVQNPFNRSCHFHRDVEWDDDAPDMEDWDYEDE